jgi:hypothetical protein
MLAAYRYDVAPNIGAQPGNTRYLLPVIHGVFGLPAQLLATFVVLRMFREDTQVRRAKARGETVLSKYWFRRAKPVMRLTLALWFLTAALGVVSYLTRYNVIPAYHLSAEAAAPVATPEVLAPLATPEVVAPVATPEVEPPIVTPEIVAPVETEALAASTPTRRPSRTPAPPVQTEVVKPVETEEPMTPTQAG